MPSTAEAGCVPIPPDATGLPDHSTVHLHLPRAGGERKVIASRRQRRRYAKRAVLAAAIVQGVYDKSIDLHQDCSEL